MEEDRRGQPAGVGVEPLVLGEVEVDARIEEVRNQFPLFGASGFGGSFVAVTLPPLSAGLAWSNKLSLNGAIVVVSRPPLASI